MSDTPRTDGIMKYCFGSDREFVAVDFCRQLERELAAKDSHADEIYKAAVNLAAKLEADLATERAQLAANHEATRLMGKWLEAERELADRLLAIAEKAVSDHEGTLHCDCDCKCSGRRIANDSAEALAAWKEARRGTV